MIRNPCRHSRSRGVLALLRESFGQPSKAAHTHRNVLALHIAHRDMRRVGIALADANLSPDALGQAVFAFAAMLEGLLVVNSHYE